MLAKFGNEPILFFTPIVPTLEPAEFTQALSDLQWQCEGVSLLADNTHAGASVEALGAGPLMHPTAQSTALQTWPANDRTPILVFAKGHSKMFLMRGGFSDCAQRADGAIAMAGTAAEQLVSKGVVLSILPCLLVCILILIFSCCRWVSVNQSSPYLARAHNSHMHLQKHSQGSLENR